MTGSAVWFRVRAGAATDAGRQRSRNEDSYLAAAPVFLVADGMGGHARGAAASGAVVAAFEGLAGQVLLAPDELQAAVTRAATAVAALETDDAAPGSTLAGVALTEQGGRGYWLVFNIGDSRVYLLRGGHLEQVSVDHSRVQELLEAGTPAAEISVGRNVITRALGGGQDGLPSADQWLVPALQGDRLVLCTDGLTTEVTDLLLLAILGSEADPQVAARALVHAAVTAGGRDNVTAVVIDAIEVEAGDVPADDEPDTETSELTAGGVVVATPLDDDTARREHDAAAEVPS